MAVIVDQGLVAERLTADDEAGPAIGPQTGHRANHPAGIDLDRRRGRATRRSPGSNRRAARQQSGGAEREGAAVEKHGPNLAALGVSLQSSRSSAGRW